MPATPDAGVLDAEAAKRSCQSLIIDGPFSHLGRRQCLVAAREASAANLRQGTGVPPSRNLPRPDRGARGCGCGFRARRTLLGECGWRPAGRAPVRASTFMSSRPSTPDLAFQLRALTPVGNFESPVRGNYFSFVVWSCSGWRSLTRSYVDNQQRSPAPIVTRVSGDYPACDVSVRLIAANRL